MGVEIDRPIFKGATFLASMMTGSVNYKQCIIVATCRVVRNEAVDEVGCHLFKFDDDCSDPASSLGLIMHTIPHDIYVKTGDYFIVVDDVVYMIHRNSVITRGWFGKVLLAIELLMKLAVCLFVISIIGVIWRTICSIK